MITSVSCYLYYLFLSSPHNHMHYHHLLHTQIHTRTTTCTITSCTPFPQPHTLTSCSASFHPSEHATRNSDGLSERRDMDCNREPCAYSFFDPCDSAVSSLHPHSFPPTHSPFILTLRFPHPHYPTRTRFHRTHSHRPPAPPSSPWGLQWAQPSPRHTWDGA